MELTSREFEAEVEEPERDAQMDIVISCWRELDTCRSVGMSIGPIPWTAIIAWADFVGFDRDATWRLAHVIRKLDNDYLAGLAAKQRMEGNRE